MDEILRTIKKFIPKSLFKALQPHYHLTMAFLAALIYGFPSRKIRVIGITGTKGKSSTVELANGVLEAGGFKTAVAGTIRFKIADKTEPNLFKMTMPGRFAIQSFLSRAVKAGCDFAVIEMTSEGAKLFRHKFIDLDALIFTNISPEHIESHGSFENYLKAKLSIAKSLGRSIKKNKALIANRDDEKSVLFEESAKPASTAYFGIDDAKNLSTTSDGVQFEFDGHKINSPLPGQFNVYNMLAAAVLGKEMGIDSEKIKAGLESVGKIKGRVEKIKEGQKFDVVVDYAHTIDSLEKLYGAFKDKNKICVLGNTGGGRDKWKRTGMAETAEKHCSHIILTNEDPYDEDPRAIVEQMAQAITDKSKLEIIMDRREAVARALEIANETNDESTAVLISGKGTDPYIMIENGGKIPWSDEKVAREELVKIFNE